DGATCREGGGRRISSDGFGRVFEVGFGRVDDDGVAYGASPDGLTVDGLGGLEIKCAKPATHFRTILEDRVPPIYMPQIGMNMLVFDRDHWDFMSHDPGQPPSVRRVPRAATEEALIL